MTYKNLHLITSSLVIIIVAFAYGICPSTFLPVLFDFKVESTDLENAFRSVMCLYIWFGIYWATGTIYSKRWQNATITCIIFMGSLAAGRVFSIVIDGMPSLAFIIGLVIEILLMTWGIFNLKKYASF